MLQLILLTILVVLGPQWAYAQTISIVNMDNSREAIVMEAALKRLLRAEGYTIQGSSTDGYVVLLHGMAAHTTQGISVGVVGSAAVGKVLGEASAAALLPEGSGRGNEFVETFTTVMGSPVIYLAGSTAVGGNAEQVAEILSSYVNMRSGNHLASPKSWFEHWRRAPKNRSQLPSLEQDGRAGPCLYPQAVGFS